MKANRICIIGGSGTGKTTLSKNLGQVLNIPICHIDGLHHTENWGINNREERDKKILDFTRKRKWIMDGTYSSTLKERIQKADFVIFLDYSLLSRLNGILKRYFKNHGKEKEEIPGCKERLSFVLLKSAFKFHGKLRKKILPILEECHHTNILVFKNRKQLNEWYEKEFHKSIVIG